MKEIYLVTKGSYSDYSVYAVFADKKNAEEYAEQISDRWSDSHVETRPIFDKSNLAAPVGFRGYVVSMDVDGNSKCEREAVKDSETFSDDSFNGYASVEYLPETENHIKNGEYNFFILTDKGSAGAIKIANERRIRMIENGTWPKKGEIVNNLYEND